LGDGRDRCAGRATRAPDPRSPTRRKKGDAHHRRSWELILADNALRAEYERLKEAGMDSAQKQAFFERVVAMLEEP